MRGNSKLFDLAKGMRRQPTDAEKLLGRRLRDRQPGGVKFRRQEPIGSYIADFVAMELRLIIELDGGQHALASTSDKERTTTLEGGGYRLIRFWNNEVLENLEGVLERIFDVVTVMKAKSHPDPAPLPPRRERER